MGSNSGKTGKFSVRAYAGDAKTLLAFNYPARGDAKNLAGFTIQVQPKGGEPYYIHNTLRFKTPGDHAQDPQEPANSSINAPIHKFRWVHIPGSVHQGLAPFYGKYRYTITPRFLDENRSLEPADPGLAADVDVRERQSGRRLHARFRSVAGVRQPFRPQGSDQSEEPRPAVRHVTEVRYQRRRTGLHLPRRIRVARLHRTGADFRDTRCGP